MEIHRKTIFIILILSCYVTIMGSCKKFLDTSLPTDKFASDGAYENDISTGAVITGIISSAASSPVYGAIGNSECIGFTTGLYTDDLIFIQPSGLGSASASTPMYFTNVLTPANGIQWTLLYRQIYSCNLAIENIEKNRGILVKYNQWMGEALFLRAFSYFDLINLYGDVPLTITSDYSANNSLGRSASAQVYDQIIKDLNAAEILLGKLYLDGAGNSSINRARPNYFTAAALLARVYLYTGNHAGAETEAKKVIDNTTLYQLLPTTAVFQANSKETIWALAPPSWTAVRDYFLYNAGAPSVSVNQAALALFTPVAMSPQLIASFETGDLRFANWTVLRTTTSAPVNGQFYFPNKYKSRDNGIEFNVVMRLAEQYLIRAEARAHLNNVTGAVEDLNVIRKRARPATPAGLIPDYPLSLSFQEAIGAIARERRLEFFTEFGHRFYDLKRMNLIDQVLTPYAITKGGIWSSYKKLWPIPANDIEYNHNLQQNPGYN